MKANTVHPSAPSSSRAYSPVSAVIPASDDHSEPAQPAAPFPLHCLPPEAEALAEAIVAAERVPASLAGPVVLGILSASVGAGLEVQSGPARLSRANLYIVPSAESGGGKSETLRHAGAPLLAAERKQVESWRGDTLPKAKADAKLLAGDIVRLEKSAGKAIDAQAREALRDELADKERQLVAAEAALQAPVLTVEDITTEKLAVLLSRRDETLFSLSSDAGAIVNNLLGRYNKAERTDETLYLKSWTGESCRVDRMGRESIALNRPCLTALWLVQPDKIESLLAVQALTDGGLLPRFLLCHSGCEPQEMGEEGVGAGVPSEVAEGWSELIGDLLAAYREREGEAAVVHPTAAARTCFREHFNASVRRYHTGELRDVNSFRARWTEQGWRIALCLHAGTWGREAAARPLAEETATAALTIVDWFSGQQLAILAKGRTERRQGRLEALCAKLVSYGGAAPLRDLHKSNGFDPDEVRALAATFPGRLAVEMRAAGPKGGRPSETAYLPGPQK